MMKMPGASGLQTGLMGGGAAPAWRAWGNRCGSPGGRKRGRRKAAGQGGSSPRALGAVHPRPASGVFAGKGTLALGAEGELLWRIWASDLRESQAVPRGGAVASSWGVARPKARSAPGGYLSPARRGAAPAERGTEAMGFRPAPQASERRERKRPKGRRIGRRFAAAPRARPSLKPINL